MIYGNSSGRPGSLQAVLKDHPEIQAELAPGGTKGVPAYSLQSVYDVMDENDFNSVFEGYDAKRLSGKYVDARGYGWQKDASGNLLPELVESPEGKACQVVRSPMTLANAALFVPSGYLDARPEGDKEIPRDTIMALEDSAFLSTTRQGRGPKSATYAFVNKGDYGFLSVELDNGKSSRTVTAAPSSLDGWQVSRNHSQDEAARQAAGLELGEVAYLNFEKGSTIMYDSKGLGFQEVPDNALDFGYAFGEGMQAATVTEDVSIPMVVMHEGKVSATKTMCAGAVPCEDTSGKKTVLAFRSNLPGDPEVLRRGCDFGKLDSKAITAPTHYPEANGSLDASGSFMDHVEAAIRSRHEEREAPAMVTQISEMAERSVKGIPSRMYKKDGPTKQPDIPYSQMDTGIADFAKDGLEKYPEPEVTWIENAALAEPSVDTAHAKAAGPRTGFAALLDRLEKDDGEKNYEPNPEEARGGYLPTDGIV